MRARPTGTPCGRARRAPRAARRPPAARGALRHNALWSRRGAPCAACAGSRRPARARGTLTGQGVALSRPVALYSSTSRQITLARDFASSAFAATWQKLMLLFFDTMLSRSRKDSSATLLHYYSAVLSSGRRRRGVTVEGCGARARADHLYSTSTSLKPTKLSIATECMPLESLPPIPGCCRPLPFSSSFKASYWLSILSIMMSIISINITGKELQRYNYNRYQ